MQTTNHMKSNIARCKQPPGNSKRSQDRGGEMPLNCHVAHRHRCRSVCLLSNTNTAGRARAQNPESCKITSSDRTLTGGHMDARKSEYRLFAVAQRRINGNHCTDQW